MCFLFDRVQRDMFFFCFGESAPRCILLVLLFNQCFVTNPFVIFISLLRLINTVSFPLSNFLLMFFFYFIFITLLETHCGLTSVITLAVQLVLTSSQTPPCKAAYVPQLLDLGPSGTVLSTECFM